MSDLLSAKRALRRDMEEKRKGFAEWLPDAPLSLRDHFLKKIQLPPKSCVALYHAQHDEMNPSMLGVDLHHAGHTLALPVITARGTPLIFRSYEPGDKLHPGPMGILEPTSEALAVTPDVLIVPLLAFDKMGYRLGYGGGYYDRTLTELRQQKTVLAVGIAYAGQEVAAVPIEPHDARLDAIVTEAQALRIAVP
ncbi:MAG TPA: 5-formyltetrahydrofolate cyclo-ligase, partial [Alphaproteobacteria bacterium]|nr:5-formyltetrahydrofolate cyclo-ligase [Alphaproteobacteria bacterium]